MTIHKAYKDEFLNQVDDGTIADGLELTHAVFYTDYDAFNSTDTKTGKNELGRVALTSSVVDNTIIKSFNISSSIANCLNTTISSASSSTVFDLTSITGLAIDDRIEITLSSGTYDRKVTNISSNTVTISEPLPSTPTAGNVVRQKISNVGFVTNGTSSSGSGTLAYSFQWIKYKHSGIEINNNQLRGSV